MRLTNQNRGHQHSPLIGQPAANKTCAVMKSSGEWAGVSCAASKDYHCKLRASSYLSCPLGWQLFESYCYLAQDELLDWQSAREVTSAIASASAITSAN